VCGYNGGGQIAIEVDRVPTQAIASFVTGRCFETFGVTPLWGRTISNDDAPLLTAGKRVIRRQNGKQNDKPN
jgi:hypothetical protein